MLQIIYKITQEILKTLLPPRGLLMFNASSVSLQWRFILTTWQYDLVTGEGKKKTWEMQTEAHVLSALPRPTDLTVLEW